MMTPSSSSLVLVYISHGDFTCIDEITWLPQRQWNVEKYTYMIHTNKWTVYINKIKMNKRNQSIVYMCIFRVDNVNQSFRLSWRMSNLVSSWVWIPETWREGTFTCIARNPCTLKARGAFKYDEWLTRVKEKQHTRLTICLIIWSILSKRNYIAYAYFKIFSYFIMKIGIQKDNAFATILLPSFLSYHRDAYAAVLHISGNYFLDSPKSTRS